MWIVGGSSALCGFAASYGELLFWRAVGGLGSAMFTISATALLLASVGPELRGRASGLYQGGFLLGGMTGPAIGGLLATISLTAPFFFYAGTLVIAGTIAFTQLHDPGHGRGGRRATYSTAADRAARRPLSGRLPARLRYRLAVVRGAFGAGPDPDRQLPRPPPSWTGIAFAIAAVAQTLALQPAGRATDLIGRRPVMVTGGCWRQHPRWPRRSRRT